MKPCSVYLAGPMRGYPLFNFPAFMQAAMKLRAAGYTVANPAERDIAAGFDPSKSLEENNFSMREAFLYDFGAITKADAVVFLPGWRKSSGSKAERLVAFHCEVPCYEYELTAHVPEGFRLRQLGPLDGLVETRVYDQAVSIGKTWRCYEES